MAGVAGLEPAPKVLETSMLTIDTIPLSKMMIYECRMMNIGIHHSSFTIQHLFVFAMHLVAAAAATELFHLKPVRRVLFVLRRHVVTLFTLGALQNYVISCHKSSMSVVGFGFYLSTAHRSLLFHYL